MGGGTQPRPILCAEQAVCPELSSSEKDSCTASCVNHESCPQGTKCCAKSPCGRPCVGKASNPAPQRSPINWRKGGPSFVKSPLSPALHTLLSVNPPAAP